MTAIGLPDFAPSATIQWTLRLEDAALLYETLRAAAESAMTTANYLEGEKYAEDQRAKVGPSWTLSAQDIERISELRSKALRFRRLASA